MHCQSCQKNVASVHQVQVIYNADGQPSVQEMHLCPPCAKAGGVPLADVPSFPKMVSMLGQAMLGENLPTKGRGGKSCPDCGWTLRDFKQTSRFGCPKDYEVFTDFVEEILENIHGFTEHCPEQENMEVQNLRTQLREAVAKEDYESAAALRDSIEAVEAENEQTSKQD